MMGVMEDREVWKLISSCCQSNPDGKEGNEREFSLMFSMVLFAFLLFVLLNLHLYKFFISCTSFFTSSIVFLLTNCWNSSFMKGKHVLLIVLSSGLEILPGSQQREFTNLVIVQYTASRFTNILCFIELVVSRLH